MAAVETIEGQSGIEGKTLGQETIHEAEIVDGGGFGGAADRHQGLEKGSGGGFELGWRIKSEARIVANDVVSDVGVSFSVADLYQVLFSFRTSASEAMMNRGDEKTAVSLVGIGGVRDVQQPVENLQAIRVSTETSQKKRAKAI